MLPPCRRYALGDRPIGANVWGWCVGVPAGGDPPGITRVLNDPEGCVTESGFSAREVVM